MVINFFRDDIFIQFGPFTLIIGLIVNKIYMSIKTEVDERIKEEARLEEEARLAQLEEERRREEEEELLKNGAEDSQSEEDDWANAEPSEGENGEEL